MNHAPKSRAASDRLRRFAVVAALLAVAGCSTLSRQGHAIEGATAQASAAQPYLFDSGVAWNDLTTQCSFGPRDPRAPAHTKCLNFMIDQLKPYCDAVTTQNFRFADPARHVVLKLTNVFGVINPTGKPRIMFSAHWDSRPTADNDFNPANRDKPIPGADDGASGVAVLLEMARVFHQERPKCGIVLAFWDGEDWGPGEDKMYLGARYFAAHPGNLRPDESILLDMIGQKGLVVPKEAWSAQNFPNLCDAVWQAAYEAGESSVFQNTIGPSIGDDQIPLARLGIPSIDLIDFDYAYWHQLADTPDKCSPKSLEAVGKTLEQYVRDVDAEQAGQNH